MITASGFSVKRLSDILSEINSEFQGNFGDNIDLEPSSPLGQIIGIFSERESLIWELAEDLYSSQYPDTSDGRSLDLTASLTGTTRRPASFSTISNGQARGDENTDVPRGTIIETSAGIQFETLSDATINIADGGEWRTANIPMRAIDSGPQLAAAGTLSEIVTPISGMDSFTNLSDAILGADSETDAELKLRRRQELNFPGVATRGAIQASLSSRPLVSSVQVFENKNEVADADGRPPHSIEAMIQGDFNDALGRALFNLAAAGTSFYGNQSVDFVDSEGFNQNVRFSRPVLTNIFAKFTITTSNDYPPNGDNQLKLATENFGKNLEVGDTIILYGSRALICVLDQIPGIVSATVEIGLAADNFQSESLELKQRELPRIPQANVTIIKN